MLLFLLSTSWWQKSCDHVTLPGALLSRSTFALRNNTYQQQTLHPPRKFCCGLAFVYGMADGERSPLLSDSRDGMNGLSLGDETYRPPTKPQSESNRTRIDRKLSELFTHTAFLGITGEFERTTWFDSVRLERSNASVMPTLTCCLVRKRTV